MASFDTAYCDNQQVFHVCATKYPERQIISEQIGQPHLHEELMHAFD